MSSEKFDLAFFIGIVRVTYTSTCSSIRPTNPTKRPGNGLNFTLDTSYVHLPSTIAETSCLSPEGYTAFSLAKRRSFQ